MSKVKWVGPFFGGFTLKFIVIVYFVIATVYVSNKYRGSHTIQYLLHVTICYNNRSRHRRIIQKATNCVGMEISMDNISIILYLYWICDFLLVLYGLPTTLEWISPPKLLQELFNYGKIRQGNVEHTLVKFIEIPKSWFKHFYMYGIVISAMMLSITVGCFMFNKDISGRKQVAEFVGARPQLLDEYSVMMICLMMLIQHTRRIYECLYVSVYSKGTMNVLHYLLGSLLYSTVQISAICDGPELKVAEDTVTPNLPAIDLDLLSNHWNKIVGAMLFVWASYYHNQSHVILANLRKDRSGSKVLHRQHVIPRGGLFEFYSAPHFVCEILIYIAMGIVAWGSWTFWMGPVLFTATNQALMISETHNWYQKKFENYPRRYRFIPYIF